MLLTAQPAAPPASSLAAAVAAAAAPARFITLALFSAVASLVAGTWLVVLAPIADIAAARFR
jgi:hypothetical protein